MKEPEKGPEVIKVVIRIFFFFLEDHGYTTKPVLWVFFSELWF